MKYVHKWLCDQCMTLISMHTDEEVNLDRGVNCHCGGNMSRLGGKGKLSTGSDKVVDK